MLLSLLTLFCYDAKVFAVTSGNYNWVLTLYPRGQILRMNAPRKALIAWNFGDKMIALDTARKLLEPRSHSLDCCTQNSSVVNELLRVICEHTFLVWVLPRDHHCRCKAVIVSRQKMLYLLRCLAEFNNTYSLNLRICCRWIHNQYLTAGRHNYLSHLGRGFRIPPK